MAITVPNAGSIYSSDASVPNSANRWAHLGFVATPGGSGSVMWFQTNASTSGCELLPIVCASGAVSYMSPLFNSPCGFYAASISGGCAVIWLKTAA